MDGLISRAAAIKKFAEKREVWYGNGPLPSNESLMCQAAISITEELPSVGAVPVAQGEWVEETDRVNHYHCSNCGVVWGVMSKAMKYCPNCAAKMMNSPMWNVDGEQEGK